jgi:four helix bundle protein
VSLVSNIAEGEGRRGDRELARYLDVARGSLHEIECQVLLALRLRYLPPDSAMPLLLAIGEVSRMLNALIRHRRL